MHSYAESIQGTGLQVSQCPLVPHRVPDCSGVKAPDIIALVCRVPAQTLQPISCAAFAHHDAVLSAAKSMREVVLHDLLSQGCGVVKGLDDVVPRQNRCTLFASFHRQRENTSCAHAASRKTVEEQSFGFLPGLDLQLVI